MNSMSFVYRIGNAGVEDSELLRPKSRIELELLRIGLQPRFWQYLAEQCPAFVPSII